MCEHCGCLSLPEIEELTIEHDAVLDLLREIRGRVSADDARGAADVCVRLSHLLAPHTVVEEEALLPALAREFPDHVAVLVAEHELVSGVLASIAQLGVRSEFWPDGLLRALDVLRAHISKEQDGVFPAALSTLTPEDWEEVDRVRARVGSALADLPLNS